MITVPVYLYSNPSQQKWLLFFYLRISRLKRELAQHTKDHMDDRHSTKKEDDDEQIALGICIPLSLWIQSLAMSGPPERYRQTR